VAIRSETGRFPLSPEIDSACEPTGVQPMVERRAMVRKVRTAVSGRRCDLFIMAKAIRSPEKFNFLLK
jgi:hypothetical protein